MKDHRATLQKKADPYIQNHLPIHLLRLEDMTLFHRSEVQNQIRLKIEKNNLTCTFDTCQCFEELKKEMQFAILSHRWGRDELSFRDLSDMTKPPSGTSGTLLRRTLEMFRSKRGMSLLQRLQKAGSQMPPDCGYTKLVKICEFAVIEDCKFVWLDTICINKESSAELEESIRSMYGWYRDSYVCIVHLAQTSNRFNMRQDQWFKRGWTLQELLAPSNILFFTRDWTRLTNRRNDKDVGDINREDPPLITTISKITNIPVNDLMEFKPGLHDVRQRMSWASSRDTTRVEDKAYCLIGIFGVSLSVAYGEREAAFYRLQVEILQHSDDRGLFQWWGEAAARNSMLAIGPECFRSIKQDAEIAHYGTQTSDPTYTLTNFGLRIRLRLYRSNDNSFLGPLKSGSGRQYTGKDIAILAQTAKPGAYLALVLQITGSSAAHQYQRVDLIDLDLPPHVLSGREPMEIFIA